MFFHEPTSNKAIGSEIRNKLLGYLSAFSFDSLQIWFCLRRTLWAHSYESQIYQLHAFLSAFTKLRKVTISFLTPVCLSAWNNWAPTRRIFIKFGI
jgi:hypothetical protein